MNLWSRIKRLSPLGVFQFAWLFITHPLHVWPTWEATKRTFALCNELFGANHHKSNKANAFRHAFWNVIICQKVTKKNKNPKKSINFTQKVTDLYEKATKNDIFDQAMDLHNNRIGRALFLEFLGKTEAEMINLVQNRAEIAQKVIKIEEIKNFENELVYIID